MGENEKLLQILADVYGLNTALFRKVHTAMHDVYTDGSMYIKLGHGLRTEAYLIEQLYPESYVRLHTYGQFTALITKAMGVMIPSDYFSTAAFDAWLEEIRRISSIQLAVPPRRLRVAAELSRLRSHNTMVEQRGYDEVYTCVKRLIGLSVPHIPDSTNGLLHGDPNFRNVVFDAEGRARLVDFDHARTGPIEWDIANVQMVCLIAHRRDLYDRCSEVFADADSSLTHYFLGIRVAQSLVHTALHIDFETKAGLAVRLQIANSYLNCLP